MKKVILMTIGSISLVLGFIGVFLPVIPTTPFVLVSLACFMNTSEKMHHFVMTNKHLGPYARAYANGEGIPKRAKLKAVFLIWITIGFSVIFVLDKLPLRIMLLVIATIVSTYIFTRPTVEETK